MREGARRLRRPPNASAYRSRLAKRRTASKRLGRRLNIRVRPQPVSCDLLPSADPDLVVSQYVIHETRQRLGAAGTTDESCVQANRHHLRLPLALLVQPVEGEPKVGEEVLARQPAGRGGELEVVGVERIRYDEPRLAADDDVVGQVVIVGVQEVSVSSITRRRECSLERPVYQPSGAAPVNSRMVATVARISARSCSSLTLE